MNFCALFIGRPVATTLLTLAVALAGVVGYFLLPVSPLPQVDFPTIAVFATMPGASPETMATSVATPLERHLGQIADVSEMTSMSGVGSTRIILQFGLDRNIDGAARDVQAAINASFADLPTSLKTNPTYRKMNPADAPILILAMTSTTLTQGQLYDSAATVIAQKLSQVDGVGQVNVGGSSLPAVRVELNPNDLAHYGIGREDVRAALASANAHAPKGDIEDDQRHYQIYTNDQANHAWEYRSLVIAYRNGNPVRLSDVAQVDDSVEDLRNMGLSNGKPSVLLIISRQPNANIITTADRVKAALPELMASIPADIDMKVVMDRTTTIRASLRDVGRTLLISLTLVVLVVYLFMGDRRATMIPSIAVPVSIIGTFGAMYLLGYSLNNLSLMALTVSTGFVVDDAIVVLENVIRHREAGMPRLQAALQGTREVAFTVISISLSLIAVFVPILLMGGLVGRLFREFALTLSVTIIISLVISLTTTPMMCATILRTSGTNRHGWTTAWFERGFSSLRRGYQRTLATALRHPWITLAVLLLTIVFNVYLYVIVPKGFFPQQDTGIVWGGIDADQSISFQLMSQKLVQFVDIVKNDPSVDNVAGFTGGGNGNATNSGRFFISLKPRSERTLSADQIIGRLHRQLDKVAGASLYLQSAQDVRAGGRSGNAQYQYTLQADTLRDLRTWTPKLAEALKNNPVVTEVNSDQEEGGLETDLVIDRTTASRLGLNEAEIDNNLYDAFGQRLVSTIYNALNQYHVVMEVAPRYWQSPETLNDLYISTAGGTVSGTQSTNALAGTYRQSAITATSAATVAMDTARNAATNALANSGRGATSTGAAVSTAAETMIPLAAIARFGPGTTPLSVNHQGHFASATISFNLAVGKSLSDAVEAIEQTAREIGMPITIQGGFAGTAKVFQDSLSNEPILILAAFIAVYIVLGILYESYIHPVTILSTLPSAGIGALLALLACDTEFSIIALIGIILLIGIVKKNAIMMIDFALDAERNRGLSSRDAIFEAAVLRFRPIMMTTMVAMLGALPLALGSGDGAEIRRPLGISIVGGLAVSQILTLYTTPIVYLFMDRLRQRRRRSSSLEPAQ